MVPLPWFLLLLYMTDFTLGYQRLSVNNNNHNNVDQKPTHLPPIHYPHGHKWSEPYFDLTMPKNITSLVGKSAYLGCRVKHLGNKTVAWIRHRDLHILTVGTYTYTTDQRFQTSYHRDIDEWTLQIKWAQQRDAGVYECQISTQPVRSFSVNLNIVDTIDTETSNLLQQYYNDDSFYISSDRVYQSNDDEFAGMFGPIQTVAVPTATILGGPDLYVDKGSTINLTCVIKFSPEPPTHIFWYHQDKVLSEETSRGRLKFKTVKSEESKSILLIHDADLLDSGKYSCYPSNTEIASIRVHVLQGERPEAMQTNAATSICSNGFQPSRIISIIVVLFAMLQILTISFQQTKNIVNNNSNNNNKNNNNKTIKKNATKIISTIINKNQKQKENGIRTGTGTGNEKCLKMNDNSHVFIPFPVAITIAIVRAIIANSISSLPGGDLAMASGNLLSSIRITSNLLKNHIKQKNPKSKCFDNIENNHNCNNNNNNNNNKNIKKIYEDKLRIFLNFVLPNLDGNYAKCYKTFMQNGSFFYFINQININIYTTNNNYNFNIFLTENIKYKGNTLKEMELKYMEPNDMNGERIEYFSKEIIEGSGKFSFVGNKIATNGLLANGGNKNIPSINFFTGNEKNTFFDTNDILAISIPKAAIPLYPFDKMLELKNYKPEITTPAEQEIFGTRPNKDIDIDDVDFFRHVGNFYFNDRNGRYVAR